MKGIVTIISIVIFCALSEPVTAIQKNNIIRFCKRSRNYHMCMRDFKEHEKSDPQKIKNNGTPIKIRVIPYRN